MTCFCCDVRESPCADFFTISTNSTHIRYARGDFLHQNCAFSTLASYEVLHQTNYPASRHCAISNLGFCHFCSLYASLQFTQYRYFSIDTFTAWVWIKTPSSDFNLAWFPSWYGINVEAEGLHLTIDKAVKRPVILLTGRGRSHLFFKLHSCLLSLTVSLPKQMQNQPF